MSEINFSDYEEPKEDYFKEYSEEELASKTCVGCVRCEPRTHAYKNVKAEGYHCCGQSYEIDIKPTDKACKDYWDKAEHEHIEKLRDEATENRRKELWAIYSKRDPIKLPIINDGYGMIPMCPTCGEMPYDLEQCHWCGQRFILDEEIKEYAKPEPEELKDCFSCGSKDTMHIRYSKYNGHASGYCEKCGMRFVE